MSLRLAAVAACLFMLALLAAGPPALAQTPANAAAQAECVACKGFEQQLKMIAQAIAALEQELQRTSARMKAITNVLFDEKRLPTTQESAEISKLGDRMKRFDETLDALRPAHSRAAQALASCNETHCRPAAPPPPILVTPGAPVTPVKPAAPADPQSQKRPDPPPGPAPWDIGGPPRRFVDPPSAPPFTLLRAQCPECLPAERRLESARAAHSAAEAENRRLYEAEKELLSPLDDAIDDFWKEMGEITELHKTISKLSEERVLGRFFSDEIERCEKRLEEIHQQMPTKKQIVDQIRDRIAKDLEALRKKRQEIMDVLRGLSQRVGELLDELITCNLERCFGRVQVDTVIGVTGTNPFNPDNPAGTPPGRQTPTPTPMPTPGPQTPTPTPMPTPGPQTPTPTPTPVQTGSLQFSAPSYASAEGQGAVTLTVTRSGGSSGAVSVRYITVSGTAGGSDFGSASAVLSWTDGDAAAKSFSITIVDDNLVEGAETFSVALSAPTGGATIGAPSTATISIADNDASGGACGPSGNAWQVNSGNYTCFGTCDPCPTPQRLTVDGNRITITPFHAGGAATFTGCFSPVTSDSGTLTYFGQSNHRATLSLGSNTTYSAIIQGSGGGTCTISCIRIGP